MTKILTPTENSKKQSDKYGIRIGPCTSLSRHRTIDLQVDVRWRDDAIAMARWCDGDNAIEHRAIAIAPSRYRHRAIALSSSRHRTIAPSLHRAIAPSHHRHRAIAPSCHRHRAIAPSSSRHRAIAPSTYKSMVRWRDSEVHGPIRIP